MILFKEKKETIFALVYSFLFCFINSLGYCAENHIFITTLDWIFSFLNAITLCIFVAELYLRFYRFITKKSVKDNSSSKISALKYYLFCTLFMTVCYIPVFLAYYPGIFAYDVHNQIPLHIGTYNNWQPLAHTLFLQFFYYIIGNVIGFTKAVAVASIIQMVLFSMMISYIHLFLYTENVNKIIRFCLLIGSSFLPFFSLLSISHTKDLLFSGFVGVYSVCTYKLWKIDNKASRGTLVIYTISVIGIILFRNNGIYALIPASLLGIGIAVKNKNRFSYIKYTLISILLGFIFLEGLFIGLSAEKSPGNEMLSVPYQQIAYVYHTRYGDLSDEDKQEIVHYIPDVQIYGANSADEIKFTGKATEDLNGFFRLYFNYLIKYPTDYVEAFLNNALGYFYIGDSTHAKIYGNAQHERRGYLLSDMKEGFGVEHTSYLKPLENLLEYLYTINGYRNIIALIILCSPASYFWLFLLFLSYGVEQKINNPVLTVFLSIYILTLLAGPCCLIRYALPYIVCLPVFIFSIMNR